MRDLGKTRKVFAKMAKCICEICVEFSLTKMKNSRVGNDCFEMIHKPGEARDVMIGAMREVLKLSELEGTGLTEMDFKEYLKIIDELNPKGMPSMRQDRLAKRPTEVESFAGTVIDKAASFGLNVPFNEKLYRQVRQFEAEYLK